MGTKAIKNLIVGFLIIIIMFSSMIQINSFVNAAGVTTAPNCVAEVIATGLDGPHNMAIDKAGSVFVPNEDGTVITEITPDGQVVTFASGFEAPAGIAFDKKGTLWVSDDGHAYENIGYDIWKVDRDGAVTPGYATKLDNPNTLAFDKDWNLFVVATGGAIYKINSVGQVSFFAGDFSVPQAIAFDKKGYVYTADADGAIWKLDPSGSTRVLYAKVNGNQGNFAFDKDDNLYVPESSGKIVVVSPSGTIKTLMQGLAAPRGVAFDKNGCLYVSDYSTGLVYKVTMDKLKHKIDVYPGQSIQLAVDWASEGDKITVHQGTYNEKVLVDKPLTLKSEGAVIDLQGISFSGPPTDNAGIMVLSPGVTISGFTIINVPKSSHVNLPDFVCAIRFFGAYSGGLVEDNEIYSEKYGIAINGNFQTAGVSEVTVRNNLVTAQTPIFLFNAPNAAVINTELRGIIDPSRPNANPNGISLTGSDNTLWSGTLIANNHIASDRNGININLPSQTPTSGIEIRNNAISAPTTIFASFAPDTVIKNNEINGGFAAVQIRNSPNVVIKNNEIHARTGSPGTQPSNGILIEGLSSGVLIKNNEVTSEVVGMFIGSPQSWPSNGPSGIQIIGNKVLNSVVAIQVNNIADVIIDGNVVFGKTNTDSVLTATGIRLNGGSLSGTIQNNEITSDLYGIISDALGTIIPDAPSNLLIKKNTIHESFEAIRVNRATENIIIEKNTVNAIANQGTGATKQPTGIYVTTSVTGPTTTNVEVTGNTVTSQGSCIQINGAASSYSILGPKIIDNIVTMTVTNAMFSPISAIRSQFAPNIVVQNNHVTANINEALAIQQPIGVHLNQGCDGGLIVGNTVSSEYGGIRLNGPSGVTVEANTINLACIGIDSVERGAPDVKIIDNTVNAVNSWSTPQRSQTASGINLVGGLTTGDIAVTGNKVTSEMGGIYLWSMNYKAVTISNNYVTSKSTAIFANMVKGAFIQNNEVQVIEGTGALYNFGIVVHGSENIISGNIISGDFGGAVGIGAGSGMIESYLNTITGNTITGGAKSPDYAFWFFGSAHDNLAEDNTIAGVDYLVLNEINSGPNNQVEASWHLSADIMPAPPYGVYDIPGSDIASALKITQLASPNVMLLEGQMAGLTPLSEYQVMIANAYQPKGSPGEGWPGQLVGKVIYFVTDENGEATWQWTIANSDFPSDVPYPSIVSISVWINTPLPGQWSLLGSDNFKIAYV